NFKSQIKRTIMDKKDKKTKRDEQAEVTQNSKIIFEISGRVIDQETKLGAADLRVEAWHKGSPDNKLIGPLSTDNGLTDPQAPLKTTAQGNFHITATNDYFEKQSIPEKPDVFFKVYGQDGKLLKSTEDTFLKKMISGKDDVVIEVDIATNSGGSKQFV